MTSGMCPELMTVSVTCGFRCQCPYQGRGQINEVTARAHLSLLAQVTSLAQFFLLLGCHPWGLQDSLVLLTRWPGLTLRWAFSNSD